ncbi:uncharacterized protein LOC143036867 isoform X2 [Oratosquilla oratoria]|uniref:uncharacterized protein LOC143036867 isoform X2 n=1 Tax=Oratosquilla oratoria TaxID=337810 RepID=UPI003F7750A3
MDRFRNEMEMSKDWRSPNQGLRRMDPPISISVNDDYIPKSSSEVLYKDGKEDSRDPHEVQTFLKVGWEYVIAEPKGGPYSLFPVWICFKYSYTFLIRFTYGLISVVFSPILILVYSAIFAWQAYIVIWCCIPVYKLFEIKVRIARMWVTTILGCLILPCRQLCCTKDIGEPLQVV